MADTDQERTEQATPKRRRDARKEGRVAKSADLVAAASLLGAVALLAFAAREGSVGALVLFQTSLGREFEVQTDVASFAAELSRTILLVFGKLALFFFVVVATTLAAHLLQTGFLFLPKKVLPDFSRVNPLKNVAKLFSFETLGRAGIGLLKMSLLFATTYLTLRGSLETILSLPYGEPLQIAIQVEALLERLGFALCGALLLVGVGDYAAIRWRLERSLRMTQQELRDEIKEESGNAQVKGRILSLRRSALGTVSPTSRTAPPRPVSRNRDAKNKEKEEERNDDAKRRGARDRRV
ncbi:MAG: EscU/YscU/HrcU family type III secretion system export apparatus switch protein [Thermoguttaceae bacterium]|nr:EscU/YscU/HrcU family type III secretion system export apparatus switch protein [Thermoguttaceae bacterium]